MVSSYPVQFDVDYPTRSLDRATTAFRIFLAIPVLVVLGTLPSQTLRSGDETTMKTLAIASGLVFLPLVLMIVFRQKYPRWWFDWNLNLLRFSNRVTVYLALLDDRYPSTDDEQAVHLDFSYPDIRAMNRWLPLIKWLLAIPHYFVLIFLGLGAVVAVVLSWFAILFTGTYPRSLFDFVVGVIRWSNRVTGYAFALVTDEYPPFSLR
ncbi:MAG TPA: DUF4389 domain-containing protein [Candidatus Dormibacteraeota bacterium]|jgi:hypothetical protein